MNRRWASGGVAVYLVLSAATATHAIHIQLDYTYDTNGFFAPGTAARQTLQHVADFYSNLLDDTFSPIVTPPTFSSSLPPQFNPGSAYWHWTMTFSNPSGPGQFSLADQPIAANEYRLYVGAKSLPGSTLGEGGPGGFSYQSTNNGGNFTPAEIDQLTDITNQFVAAVSQRGEPNGFARWGGSVSFDLDVATVWHFDRNTPPPAGSNDFLSVAVHEIGHALGLGSSQEWNNLTTGAGNAASFIGAQATAAYGGSVPLAFNFIGGNPVADIAHWRNGTMSTVLGSSIAQEAALDPSLTTGTRKRLTKLDAAALSDIGWTVVPPSLLGDFNKNLIVDAADYTLWRDGLGGQYAASDYADWKSNFGQTGGSGAAAALAAVPEPNAAILAFATIFLALAPLRRPFPGAIPRRRLS